MIKATFLIPKRGRLFVGYSLEGHANYAPRGQDIVCAGVSALFDTITFGYFEKKHRADVEGQKVTLRYPSDTDNMVVDLLLSGLRGINVAYPGCIEIEVIEIDQPLPYIGDPPSFDELLSLRR